MVKTKLFYKGEGRLAKLPSNIDAKQKIMTTNNSNSKNIHTQPEAVFVIGFFETKPEWWHKHNKKVTGIAQDKEIIWMTRRRFIKDIKDKYFKGFKVAM